MLIVKMKAWQTSHGYYQMYGKQNNSRIGLRKVKVMICRRPDVLLSSFDSNLVCGIMYCIVAHVIVHKFIFYL